MGRRRLANIEELGGIEGEPIMVSRRRDIDRLALALRDLGLRQSLLEMALMNLRARESRPLVRAGDPPCIVCGRWSEDWLCPDCSERWWWTHPLRRV
jgi:hypothetical protein